ncbi:V-type proton ATPase subunit e 2-like [Trichogramma pretiosum]|uniref:V-type proton ATPase subunit e 2-like n=1 Tax=Trichogramma pretiosum TaxID=7493 RepID=UPI0006C9A6EB|nr:V-type proton ATPase subunit e 2-like [Trichogramma pretiosum]
MGAAFLPVLFFTALWAGVGIVLPFFIPKGPNKGILHVILLLTAFTCWLFWLCCYMAQMNPLVGPLLSRSTILAMGAEWEKNNPFQT